MIFKHCVNVRYFFVFRQQRFEAQSVRRAALFPPILNIKKNNRKPEKMLTFEMDTLKKERTKKSTWTASLPRD